MEIFLYQISSVSCPSVKFYILKCVFNGLHYDYDKKHYLYL